MGPPWHLRDRSAYEVRVQPQWATWPWKMSERDTGYKHNEVTLSTKSSSSSPPSLSSIPTSSSASSSSPSSTRKWKDGVCVCVCWCVRVWSLGKLSRFRLDSVGMRYGSIVSDYGDGNPG